MIKPLNFSNTELKFYDKTRLEAAVEVIVDRDERFESVRRAQGPFKSGQDYSLDKERSSFSELTYAFRQSALAMRFRGE